MLKHAVLALEMRVGDDPKFLAIPVMNFPLLPVGSSVDIYIGGAQLFEDATIAGYRANNEHGTEILLEIGDSPMVREQWTALAKLCHFDPENYYNFLYPGVLDYMPPPLITKH